MGVQRTEISNEISTRQEERVWPSFGYRYRPVVRISSEPTEL